MQQLEAQHSHCHRAANSSSLSSCTTKPDEHACCCNITLQQQTADRLQITLKGQPTTDLCPMQQLPDCDCYFCPAIHTTTHHSNTLMHIAVLPHDLW